jgi:hypothetical protein
VAFGKKLQSVNRPLTYRHAEHFAWQEGHIFDAKVLVCGDDAEAVEKAKDAFEDRVIEVWSAPAS